VVIYLSIACSNKLTSLFIYSLKNKYLMKAKLVEDYLKQHFQIYKNNNKSEYYNYIILKGNDMYSVKIEPGHSMQWKYEGAIDKQKYSINGTLVTKPSKEMIFILQNTLKPIRAVRDSINVDETYMSPEELQQEAILMREKNILKRQEEILKKEKNIGDSIDILQDPKTKNYSDMPKWFKTSFNKLIGDTWGNDEGYRKGTTPDVFDDPIFHETIAKTAKIFRKEAPAYFTIDDVLIKRNDWQNMILLENSQEGEIYQLDKITREIKIIGFKKMGNNRPITVNGEGEIITYNSIKKSGLFNFEKYIYFEYIDHNMIIWNSLD
jgi:hypothetical protein